MSLDDFIIDRVYQKITNRVADGFERSCYWLARQAAFAGTGIGIVWAVTSNRSLGGVVFFISCQILFAVGACWRSNKAEARWRAGSAALSQDRIEDLWWRYVYLFFVVLWLVITILSALAKTHELFVDSMFLVSMVGVSSSFYFMACYPRTPRRKPAKVPVDAVMQGVP